MYVSMQYYVCTIHITSVCISGILGGYMQFSFLVPDSYNGLDPDRNVYYRQMWIKIHTPILSQFELILHASIGRGRTEWIQGGMGWTQCPKGKITACYKCILILRIH